MSLVGTAILRYCLATDPPFGTSEQYCCGYSEGGNSYSGHWPSIAYFCPNCGQLWGKIIFGYMFAYQLRLTIWRVEERACEECGGGELLNNDTLAAASPSLLQRELNILLTKYEKGLQ